MLNLLYKLYVAGDNEVRDHDRVTGNIEFLLIGVVKSILNWLKNFLLINISSFKRLWQSFNNARNR